MKTLYILPFVPVPDASVSASRMFHMLRTMSLRHEITVLAFGAPEEHDILKKRLNGALHGVHLVPHQWPGPHPRTQQLYSAMTGRSARKMMQRTLEILLFENDFDLIQAEYPVMGSFNYDSDALKVLDFGHGKYQPANRTLHRFASPLRMMGGDKSRSKGEFYYDIALCSRFDAVIVSNEQEKCLLERKLPGKRSFVIPNGVRVASKRTADSHGEPYSVFIAGINGQNTDETSLARFLDQTVPAISRSIPDIKFYLPADRLSKKLNRFHDVLRTVKPEERLDALRRSSIVVAPIDDRPGQPESILEAMSLQKPVLATRQASDGIDAVNGESILEAQNPGRIAAGTIELLTNSALHAKIGEGGYELVRSSYDWPAIGDRIDRVYSELRSSAVPDQFHLLSLLSTLKP